MCLNLLQMLLMHALPETAYCLPMSTDKLISLAEAARRLGLGRGAISTAIERGQVETVELGARRYITEDEFSRFHATIYGKKAQE